MNLNISNLLNTLQGYYNPKNSSGERYTGAEAGLSKFITAYGLSGAVTNDELTAEHLSKVLLGHNITVSSEKPVKFSYKIDDENGKVIIFGNNLTITVEEGFEDTVEVVGISNVVNGSSGDDKITLIGYDNRVNADDGNDNVEVYGEDNTLKDSETNIFAGVGGQTLIFGDKTFEIGMKDTSADDSKIQISTNQTGEMTINAQNAKIIAQDDSEDNITLVGNNNYLDTSDGADNIIVKGEKNTVVTGDDDKSDTVSIEGKNNTVLGDEEDIVTHKGTSGSFNLSIADTSAHYLEVVDKNGVSHKFAIERTSDDKEDVVVLYSVNEDNQIVFTCNNVKILAQDDADEEIIINGNNNYIDVSAGDDKVTVNGDNNMIIPGDGDDLITVNGQANQVSGDNGDEVYYTADSGAIVLTNDDDAAHYINVNGASYLIQRNPAYESSDNITVSYKLNSQGIFEIEGNNFSIIETNDIEDNIKITGNNNYIDVSSKDDNVTVIGDGNSVTAGAGDDNIVVIGKNNQVSGDAGKDTIASSDSSNTTSDKFEIVDKIVTLTSSYQAETVTTSDKKTYTLKLTDAAKKAGADVNIVFRERDGKVIIEADGIIVEAGKGQEDDITFKGSNSRVFAADKDDKITVIGDKNNIDGWTGDDKITATGRENKVYGFFGNDDITIVQRESSEAEIAAEVKNVADKDDDGNTRTDAEKQSIAQDNLAKAGANKVDGEWGEDTVYSTTTSSKNTSIYKYTDVSINTEIIKSLSQTVKLKHNDDEKRIVLTDDSGNTYSYTIKNHVSTNNPFVGDREVSYDFVDVTDEEGNITKKLVIKGNYIDVKADDGQEDNVEIIGDGNHIDLGDEMDYLEAQGNYNLIFVGKGNDYINVKGDENEIYGEDGDDTITVNGSKNKVDAGEGNDTLKLYGDSFKAFGADGDDNFDVNAINSEFHGGKGTNTVTSNPNGILTNTFEDFVNDPTPKPDEDLFVISPDNPSQKITIGDLSFDVTANIENLAGNIYVSYRTETLEDGEEQIIITGSDVAISLENTDKSVNVKLVGNNILFGSCGQDDIIEVEGHNNTINAGRGSNTINVKGNHNTIDCGRSTDDIDNESVNNVTVKGDYNTVENINDDDEISLTGVNNVEISLFNHERKGGSFVLTNTVGKQTIVMDSKHAYEFSIYNVKEDDLEDVEINVRYSMDNDGNLHFYANNVKIRVIDSEDVIQGASIVLHGNNSYVRGGYGQDVLTVYGNNNIIDGWYGDDSFAIYGENNDVRGYYGDDTATLYGNKNKFNGEQGEDTVNIDKNGTNKYENVENVEIRDE